MVYDEILKSSVEPVTEDELFPLDTDTEIRVMRQSEYVAMSNDFLLRAGLSLKAKGLLALLMVLPKNFKPSVKNLCRICTEGETAIESALKELKDGHYFIAHKFMPGTIGNSRLVYKYYVYEHPYMDAEQEIAFHEAEAGLTVNMLSQGGDSQGVENHPLESYKERKEAVERSGEEEEKEERSIKKNKEEEEGKKDTEEKKETILGRPIDFIAQKGLFDDPSSSANGNVTRKVKFIPPTVEEVAAYCASIGSNVDPVKFVKWYDTTEWKTMQGEPVKNWKLKLRIWSMRNADKDSFTVERPATASEEPAAEVKLPKMCEWALNELGMYDWLKYKDDFAEGARALAKWHKATVKYDEHWVCVYYAEDFWKSYLSYVFDVTDGRAPSNGHFYPDSKTHRAWLKEMDL